MMVMEKKMTLKRCSSMSLAENIAQYEDILIEILVRVPARPLVRFKCVSKRWLSLISDPIFRRRHAGRNPRPNTSAFFAPNSDAFRFSNSNHSEVIACDPLKFVDCDIEIVQSCNGFLLCRLRDLDFGWPSTSSSLVYYVVNPTTNEFRLLTPPEAAAAAESPYRIFGYGLAFHPSISPHYKVFFLWSVDEPEGAYRKPYRVEIFSSETRSWRMLDSIFLACPRVDYRLCTYHNGALHWAGPDCEISYYHIDENRLGYVDGLPEYFYSEYFVPSRYFRESLDGTHLHLIDIYRAGRVGRLRCLATFKVLEMEKDYSGWSVKYNVDLDPLCTAYPSFLQDFFTVMSFAAAADDQLLLCSPGKVIVYNIRNNTFKSTQVTENKAIVLGFVFAKSNTNFHYIESLGVV